MTPHLTAYFVYQGLVQVFQARYQKARHYARMAMGKVSRRVQSACEMEWRSEDVAAVVLNHVLKYTTIHHPRPSLPVVAQAAHMDVAHTETLTEWHRGLTFIVVLVIVAQVRDAVLQVWP